MRQLCVLISLMFLLLATACSLCGEQGKVEQKAVSIPFVEMTVQANLQQTQKIVNESFSKGEDLGYGKPIKEHPSHPFLNDFYLFDAGRIPDDFQLGVRVKKENNQALARYLSISPENRKNDFFLYEPGGDKYWFSEYYKGDKAVPFRVDFIIHMEEMDSERTKIEVIEMLPSLNAGKKFGWEMHGFGFGCFADIREVSPTNKERTEVLDVIDETIHKKQS